MSDLRAEVARLQPEPGPCGVPGHTMEFVTHSVTGDENFRFCLACVWIKEAREEGLVGVLNFIVKMETMEANAALRKVIEEIHRLRGAK